MVPMDPIGILLSAAGALLLLFMSVGIGLLLRQGERQATKTDEVKGAISALQVSSGVTETRLTTIESRVDDLHKRRNEEQTRVFTLAADAIIELRDANRRKSE